MLLAQSEYSTIVRIEVLAEPEIEKAAYDIVLEELSALDDVRVQGRGEIFGLKVMITAIRPPKARGNIWGYAATLIVERYPGLAFIDQVDAALAAHKEGQAYQKLAKQVMERGVINYATMKVVTKDALPELCRELVAIFNTQVLDPDRKRFAELIELEKEVLAEKLEEDRIQAEAEAKAAEERRIKEEERKAAELAEAKKSKLHRPKTHAAAEHGGETAGAGTGAEQVDEEKDEQSAEEDTSAAESPAGPEHESPDEEHAEADGH